MYYVMEGSQQLFEAGTTVILISPMRKLRHREVKGYGQILGASTEQSQDLQGILTLVPVLLTTLLFSF